MAGPVVARPESPVSTVVGVDGCPAGWVLAVVSGPDPASARLELLVEARFAGVLSHCRAVGAGAVGVDIPIGFAADGCREAEIEGRRRLGGRRSTLFPSPARATLEADNWDQALAVNRAVTGKGLSLQSYNLLARSREVRAAITPSDQPWCSEVHPELSFTAMAGHPLEPKRTPIGLDQRRLLVTEMVGSLPAATPSGAKLDDVLDACAAAWSARRMASGTADTLGRGVDPDGYALALMV